VGAQQAAIFESPLLFECLLDAGRDCFLHFWKFILAAILFVVLVCGFDQHLLIHECIAVIVDPHHAIQCLDEGPIECRSQSLALFLENVECSPDLQKPRTAAVDRYR